jgi:hypothetical protein
VPLTSAQIVSIACQIARFPGATVTAGQMLNSILSDLCQTYDFDLAKGTYNFNFNVGIVSNANFPNVQAGSGPYTLPAPYLRAVKGECIWFNQGVPYPLIPVDLDEFDWQVQQAGNQAYPYLFATDMSQTPPVGLVWPGASGAYPVTIRYYQQMPDIGSGATSLTANGWNSGTATPDVSPVVPWFPNQRYLLKQLAGMVMELADDERAQTFLGDGDPNNPGAQAILRHYLALKDDNSDRAKTVGLDRRRFSRNFYTLPDTKRVGF